MESARKGATYIHSPLVVFSFTLSTNKQLIFTFYYFRMEIRTEIKKNEQVCYTRYKTLK